MGDMTPVVNLSYNHTGPNAGSFHVEYASSKAGNTVSFDIQPYTNYSDGQGVSEQHQLYDTWKSKDLERQDAVSLQNIKSFFPNNPNIVAGPGKLVFSNVIENGKILPMVSVVQGGKVKVADHGWHVPETLGKYYEQIMMQQNNWIGQTMRAQKQVRQNY